MALVHATKENVLDLIKQDNVLVDFYAEWCGPCKMITPILEEIAGERSDVTLVKVNVDELEDIAKLYNILTIPTILFFKNGEVKDTTQGFQSKEMLTEFIDNNM